LNEKQKNPDFQAVKLTPLQKGVTLLKIYRVSQIIFDFKKVESQFIKILLLNLEATLKQHNNQRINKKDVIALLTLI